jgi:subtilisin family serine protease
VQDELILSTDDSEVLDGFVQRWSGTVLREIDLDASGMDVPSTYVVQIDPSSADVGELPRHIVDLDELVRGTHRFSSQRALKLFAVAAQERAERELDVGLNFILEPQELRTRSTAEAPMGAAASGGAYSPNAADWPYMARGTNQDIGVIEAWRVLAQTGRLTNRITIGIADGGFGDLRHLPSDRTIYPAGAWMQRNSWGCGPGNPCPWHGTDVAGAAMGLADDGRGAAGPGGPVARAAYLQTPSQDFGAILAFIEDAVLSVVAERPRIINISAGGWLPAGAALLANGLVNDIGGILRVAGALVIASAGNDGDPVDSEDCARVCGFGHCLGGCWETGTHIPCENDDIVCVGGLAWDSTNAHPASNFGSKNSNTVDIWAPYEVWTGPTPGAPGVDTVTGTSFAAPFVAGVAALVMAADPDLGPAEVENILIGTAHTGGGNRVNRWVNAFGAIQRVYGGDVPPYVNIARPREGAELVAGRRFTLDAEVDDPEDAVRPDFRWLSDRDGEISISPYDLDFDEPLSYGMHTLTAEATDSAGQTATDTVRITITNQAPTIEITQPDDGVTRFTTETLMFRADVSDPNETPGESSIVWSSDLDGALGTGRTLETTLSRGEHTITARVNDQGGLDATDQRTLTVEPSPSNPPPQNVTIVEPMVDPDTGEAFARSAPSQDSVYVSFEGTATDPEGEDLTFEWRTDRDDLQDPFLATGRSTGAELHHTSSMHCHYHQLELTVTDEAGHSRTDRISICVIPIGG